MLLLFIALAIYLIISDSACKKRINIVLKVLLPTNNI